MSNVQIKQEELAEFTKMMNWGLATRDIIKISVYGTNDRIYIATVEHAPVTGDHKTVMGNGKTLLDAMASFTRTRNELLATEKIFNSNKK